MTATDLASLRIACISQPRCNSPLVKHRRHLTAKIKFCVKLSALCEIWMLRIVTLNCNATQALNGVHAISCREYECHVSNLVCDCSGKADSRLVELCASGNVNKSRKWHRQQWNHIVRNHCQPVEYIRLTAGCIERRSCTEIVISHVRHY